MVFSGFFLSFSLLSAASSATRLPTHHKFVQPVGPLVQRDLPDFIASQRTRSVDGIVANIGPDGKESSGAAAGIVIASPSTVNPNYLYSWIRDGALTMQTVVDEVVFGNTGLQSHIEDYINATAHLQVLVNPSGSLQDGTGLGEPKYHINLTAFKGPWGRPQRDGPALRAITLMSYSEYLIGNGKTADVTERIWPVIRNDLNYVAQYWNNTGFDLWEEVEGSSFFTILNSHRALHQGSKFAASIGQKCDGCDTEGPLALCFLQSFWNGTSVVANINDKAGRSGRDANSLLGSIAAFDIDGSCSDGTFQPCNSKMLASHKVLVDSFRDIYAVNANKTVGQAVAIGRYPEDVYYGGNPWYLTTLSAAELLYSAIAQWKAQGGLTVDSTSAAFFKDIYPSIQEQTYANTSTDFSAIVTAVSNYADGFVSVVQNVTPTNGSLNEQFNRNTSEPLSAIDLTWSFASFVTMAQRRSGQYPPSWGSSDAKSADTCAAGGVAGTYAPAIAAGAPNIECALKYQFNVLVNTTVGESIYIFGNSSQFGSGDPAQGWLLDPKTYTVDNPRWFLDTWVYPGQTISYKYARYGADGSWVQEDNARVLTSGACGSGNGNVNDVWNTAA